MKSNSKRLVSIGVALLFVVIALVVFFDLIQPEYANIQQTKGQIVAENELYQTESQAVTAAEKVISEYQQQQSQGGENIALALPTDEDVAGAITQIYGLAQNNGLEIQALTISAPNIQPASTPAAGSGSPSATTKPPGNFSLQISALGTYENFKNFISDIETNVRIFDVKSMTLAATQAGSGSPGKNATPSDFFSYTLTVTAYYQTN